MTELFPLTLSQRDIYFDQLHHGDEPLYNVGGYIRLGRVDVDRLAAAQAALVSGWDAFGIRIVTTGRGVLQRIAAQRTLGLPLFDFSARRTAEADANEWIRGYFQRTFELEDAELFRGCVIRIAEDRHWYVAVAHQVIMDGWGFSNLARELCRHYNAEPATFDPPPWRQIAMDDEHYLSSAKYQQDKAYWAAHLLQVPEPLLTPRRRANLTEVPRTRSTRLVVPLSEQEFANLASTAKLLQVGVPHVLAALTTAYFAVNEERDSVVLGMPFHNRRSHVEKRMLGVFTGLTPLLIQAEPSKSLRELILHVARLQKASYRHQRYPIGHIVRDLRIRSDERALYDVGFNYLKLNSELSFSGEAADLVYLSHNHHATPLTLTAWEYGDNDSLELQLDYNHAYFLAKDAHALADRLRFLIQELPRRLAEPLSELDVLPHDERARLMTHVAASREKEHAYPSALAMFAAHAREAPNEIAIRANGGSHTYGELDRSSDQVAAVLAREGIVPGARVAVLMEKSAHALSALIGVLKSGATCVPLDPSYPLEWNRAVVLDSRPNLVLSEADCARLVGEGSVPVLLVSECLRSNAFGVRIPTKPHDVANLADVAFELYPWASTGIPRRIEITQHGLAELLQSGRGIFSRVELEHVLVSTPWCETASLFEVFAPLSAGTRCVLAENAMTSLDAGCDASFMSTTPSLAKRLLRFGVLPKSVETIALTGEPVSASLINELLARQACNKVVCLYGSPEIAGFGAHTIHCAPLEEESLVVTPTGGCSLTVLRTDKRIAPYGSVGHLHLAHDAACGAAERTSLEHAANRRLYSTGYLARMREDGCAELVRRTRDCVTIDRSTVDLGEVRSRIEESSDVAGAIVIANKTRGNGPYIEAFVEFACSAPKSEDEDRIAALRTELRSKLPSHMAPTHWTVVAELPLTPSGVVDEARLAAAGVSKRRDGLPWDESVLDDSAIARALRGKRLRQTHTSSASLALVSAPIVARQLFRVAAESGFPVEIIVLAAHCKVVAVLSGQQRVQSLALCRDDGSDSKLSDVLCPSRHLAVVDVEMRSASWRELLDRTARALWGGAKCELSELAGRRLSTTVLFEYADRQLDAFAATSRTDDADAISLEGGRWEVDLRVSLGRGGDGVPEMVLAYDGAVIESEFASRIAAYYARVIELMSLGLDDAHDSMTLLSTEETRRMLCDWNATDAEYPTETCVHELFEAQVERTADAVAIICDDDQLTYRDLNARANRVAHFLRKQGLVPGQPIGVCFDRSIDMIVAILGVLKAGGAYVPLDPLSTSDRRRFIIEDSGISILLQHSARGEREHGSVQSFGLGDVSIQAALHACSTANLDRLPGQSSRALVYVIYTSGTSGRPKGVMIEHHSIVNLTYALAHALRGSGDGAWAWVAPYTFDASIKGITQMLAGRPLLIVSDSDKRDPGRLRQHFDQHRVAIVDCTPSLLELWLDLGLSDVLPDPIIGGEAISASLWERLVDWQRRYGRRAINVYGPTECSVDSTLCFVSGQVPHIGRPLQNVHAYVMDAGGDLLPQGCVGELCIGGVGVARGYLNRKELTAERFTCDPFGNRAGQLLYKTGDLARWSANGVLEYLGRLDEQVKIRGFRVEPGEIEHALRQLPGIADAAVVVQDDERATAKRLVAFMVPTDRQGVAALKDAVALSRTDAAVYRDALARSLPDYMLPAAFAFISHMPLTGNGKIDRGALTSTRLVVSSSESHVSPVGEVEQAVARIWQDVLQVARVGRDDNFFELGGHSLLVPHLVEQTRRAGFNAEMRSVFAHPTLSGFAATVSAQMEERVFVPPPRIPAGSTTLSPDMLPLVDLGLEHIDAICAATPGGAPNVQDAYPLAAFQEGILLHHLIAPNRDPYVVSALLAVESRAQLEAFTAALQRVINRHDILRTAILWKGLPHPVQVVCRFAQLSQQEITLREGSDALTELRMRMKSDSLTMRLHAPPLLSVQIAQDSVSERRYVLLGLHHIISDHVTLQLIFEEIATLIGGRAEQLPKPIAFRDFVAHNALQSRSRDAKAFFSSRLGDVEHTTAPYGIVDPPARAEDIHEAHCTLDSTVAVKLREEARRQGVSPAILFHAATALMIARTCAQNDVVFGTVLSGRMQRGDGIERAAGVFMNALPLRLRLEALTVLQMLQQTRDELVELLEHEWFSLAVAQRCSALDGAVPLFTTLLNYRHSDEANSLQSSTTSAGLELLAVHERTHYPIAIHIDDTGRDFHIVVQTEARIDASRVVELLRYSIERMTHALTHAPHEPVLALSLMSDREQELIVKGFNATSAPQTHAGLIHRMIEAQVRKTPTAQAVTCGDESLTYEDLNRRANQLARYLRASGLATGMLVGVYVDRSVHMVVALLAVLKAGGAYVPLDPSYPTQRLLQVARDAQLAWVLTHERVPSKLLGSEREFICMDRECERIARQPDTDLVEAEDGRDAKRVAYVIYTSGSTGVPKGVMVEHAGVTNFLSSMQLEPGMQAGDRVLAVTTLSFDIAGLEIYLPLITGATVVVASHEAVRDPRLLADAISRHNITVMQATPSTWQMLLSAGWQGSPRLKALCGGEAMSTSLAETLSAKVDSLWNMYGPTETTIWSSCHRVRTSDLSAASTVTIGRPIQNTQMYILDDQRRCVPLGLVGELFIGGAGVARGYLNRPELNAERFVPDPFSLAAGRLYRTGDLARWRPDGCIEFIGRNDTQIKIRGYRVELQEIEQQLCALEDVNAAVVIARPDETGRHQLVAYTVYRASAEVSSEVERIRNLRSELRARMPDYMVPSVFVFLDDLPLTPNGKLDRKALAQIEVHTSRERSPPETETEAKLAEFCADVLGVPSQRIHLLATFFELGGHSLLLIKLANRIMSEWDIELPVGTLFDDPTIRDLARRIDLERAHRYVQERMASADIVAEGRL